MTEGRRRRGHGERTTAPAWAGLLSTRERHYLDTVARQWAGPGVTTACLKAVVEAALDEAAADYDRAAGNDFVVPALLALRAQIRQSRRIQSPPPAP